MPWGKAACPTGDLQPSQCGRISRRVAGKASGPPCGSASAHTCTLNPGTFNRRSLNLTSPCEVNGQGREGKCWRHFSCSQSSILFYLHPLLFPYSHSRVHKTADSFPESPLDSEMATLLCRSAWPSHGALGEDGTVSESALSLSASRSPCLRTLSRFDCYVHFEFAAFISYSDTWACSSLPLSWAPDKVIYVFFRGFKKSLLSASVIHVNVLSSVSRCLWSIPY